MPTIALPGLRGTAQQVLYGFTRITSCMTKVTTFNNASEQRWPQRPPLYKFQLPMSSLLNVDRNLWLSFFTDPQVLGQYGTTATVTIGGVTYSNLTLDSDSFAVTTHAPGQYNIDGISLKQVVPANFSTYSPPSVGSSYPNLKFGFGSTGSSGTEYPFTVTAQFRTSNSDNPFGAQYNFPWYANGLAGFPTTPLRLWTLDYPLLTDTDLATLETFFLGKQGRATSFSFTDPTDGTTYSHVRFASDEFRIRYIAPGQNSTTIQLVETNNS